jgi:hypothetical protein
MSFWNYLVASPVFLIATIAVNSTVLAQETVQESKASAIENLLHLEGNPTQPNAIAQVTSVSQLSDVQPTDWAFQALQSLVYCGVSKWNLSRQQSNDTVRVCRRFKCLFGTGK